jgi:protein-L-isoaspartate O-methyltransferase
MKSAFRPDYYEFWPVFNDIELAARIRQMHVGAATHFSPHNLTRALVLGLISRAALKNFILSSPVIQRELLSRLVGSITGDPIVAGLFADVPRERFAPEPFRPFAYLNISLPFAEGSVITEPGLLSLLLANLRNPWIVQFGFEQIVEVGCGCGLHLYCLKKLFPGVRRHLGFERNVEYAEFGRGILRGLGCTDIKIYADAFSFDLIDTYLRTLIVVTATARPIAVDLFKDNCSDRMIFQMPRYLTEKEFLSTWTTDPYLRRTFRSYNEYINSAEYACITNIWCADRVVHDVPFLYDVRFVPLLNGRVEFAYKPVFHEELLNLYELM